MDLENAWEKYPVLRIDFANRNFNDGEEVVRKALEAHLSMWEQLHLKPSESPLTGDLSMTREEFDNNCELLIIGGGDDKYERFLREEVARLKLRNVRFTGFLSGEEKDCAIASCSVIANPSDFENLGMVILEGLVRGIPCIATTGSPWEKLIKHQCGWWLPAEQDAISNAVLEALLISDDALKEMGNRGKSLVEEEYSVTYVAQQKKTLYEWILGIAEKPDFVYEKA